MSDKYDTPEWKAFHRGIAELAKTWDFSQQDPAREPPATPEEREVARRVISEVITEHEEKYASKKPTLFVYKNGGKYYFNSDEDLPDCDLFSEAIEKLREKYDPTGLMDYEVCLTDKDGNSQRIGLWEVLKVKNRPKTWQHVGELARRATLAQSRYKGVSDPQVERSLLMKKHGVSWKQAIKRWPLTDYPNWE